MFVCFWQQLTRPTVMVGAKGKHRIYHRSEVPVFITCVTVRNCYRKPVSVVRNVTLLPSHYVLQSSTEVAIFPSVHPRTLGITEGAIYRQARSFTWPVTVWQLHRSSPQASHGKHAALFIPVRAAQELYRNFTEVARPILPAIHCKGILESTTSDYYCNSVIIMC